MSVCRAEDGSVSSESAYDDECALDCVKDELREAIHLHLMSVGFSRNDSGYFIDGDLTKQRIRDFHSIHRGEIIDRNREFVENDGPGLISCFANGSELDVSSISPELVEVVPNSPESSLFKFASLLWSVPVSRGFGRRLRFLVRDRQNGCLIGLLALGDPVFNLSARDDWVGWTRDDRRKRLVNVLDAYVVGAVPPYSFLIGGKLVAALVGSREISAVFERKYANRMSVISGEEKHAKLVLLRTMAALGRSSIYNRLVVPGGPRFIRIGTTKGYGHFHLSGDVFDMLRSYLEMIGHPCATGNRFGDGSNWKIRVISTALRELGIDSSAILRHGIEREVYAIPLASNWREVLLGDQNVVCSLTLPSAEIADFCLRRWVIPRSKRDCRYRKFDPTNIVECLLSGEVTPDWQCCMKY